jgi:predicted nuclease of predicted toxin-antitoxin system
MNLLADEGVDRQVVLRLRSDGHEVVYVAEMKPGIGDEVVLERANAEAALLVTQDNDFGELVFRQRLVHSGVVLVRLAGLSAMARANLVSGAIEQHGEEMHNAFTVISPGRVRIRK